jgi:hypothetical protein
VRQNCETRQKLQDCYCYTHPSKVVLVVGCRRRHFFPFFFFIEYRILDVKESKPCSISHLRWQENELMKNEKNEDDISSIPVSLNKFGCFFGTKVCEMTHLQNHCELEFVLLNTTRSLGRLCRFLYLLCFSSVHVNASTSSSLDATTSMTIYLFIFS